MPDYRTNALRDVSGIAVPLLDGDGTIRFGNPGPNNLRPFVIVWIEREEDDVDTYYATGTTTLGPQEFANNHELVEAMAVRILITVDNLEGANNVLRNQNDHGPELT